MGRRPVRQQHCPDTIKVGTTTYHPSDIAGISWFSHASPSSQQNGLYSYKGYLKTPNTTC